MQYHYSLKHLIILPLSALISSACVAAPLIGDIAPADIGHNPAGDAVLITNYPGKVVILTFWATWCPYCIRELPILEAIQNKAGGSNMQVIAVNIEDADIFRRATRLMRDSMHLNLLRDSTGDARKAYGVRGIPHMVIIGRDGRILRIHSGYSEDDLDGIVEDVNEALAQPTPSLTK